MLPRLFEITAVRPETAAGEVFTWELASRDGERLGFRPGQFNMLYHVGSGEVPISISGDAEDGRLIHTLRAVGGVTRLMQQLKPGDVVGVRGPFGSHWPVEAARGRDLMIVAGGIGLAPLRPVMYHALRHRDEFKRVFLLYGTREPRDLLFREELAEWRARFDLEVQITVDRGGADWRGNIGVVTTLIERGGFDPATTVAMICGPEIMMRFAVLALEKRGVDPERIYVSMERNMKCAIGHCGHCQLLPFFVCKDGPVFRFDRVAALSEVREL